MGNPKRLSHPSVKVDGDPVQYDRDRLAAAVQAGISSLFLLSAPLPSMADGRTVRLDAADLDLLWPKEDGSGRSTQSVFVSALKTEAELGQLADDLEPHDDGWKIGDEIKGDNPSSDVVFFAIRLSRNGPFVGMAILRRRFDIRRETDPESRFSLSYDYFGDHLFMIPWVRGKGLSSYLRYCVAELIRSDLECLRAYAENPPKFPDAVPAGIGISMYSEAHSDGGLYFLDEIRVEIDYLADIIFGDPDYKGPEPYRYYDYGL